MTNFINVVLAIGILLGFFYLISSPNEAEYNSCMTTMTDKSICTSLNPNK
jgi:hypothetical protein